MAVALEHMCAPGQPLHVEARDASWRLHTPFGVGPHGAIYDAERLRLHEAVIETYLSEHGGTVPRDGLAAIVTAGPPGAGKSTALDSDSNYKTWRRIDADRVKTMLLDFDVTALGSRSPYRDLLDTVLPDGSSLMPMELAGLVHHESTRIADEIADRCRAEGENLIIEGTLAWSDQGDRLAHQFATSGYESLRLVLVEAEMDVVIERALSRWWQGRAAGAPGGRFTPAAAIAALYDLSDTPDADASDLTVCAAHARRAIAAARARHMDADFLAL